VREACAAIAAKTDGTVDGMAADNRDTDAVTLPDLDPDVDSDVDGDTDADAGGFHSSSS
jgi:hypothetical protein